MSQGFVPIPTICLFRVEPAKLLSEYVAGKYNRFKVPRLRNKNATNVCEQGLINQIHGTSGESDTFSFGSKSGSEIVFVTTNNRQYKIYHFAKKGYPGGECKWCKLNFETGMGGIPVSVIYEKPEDDPNGKPIMCFLTVEELCDYRCALAYLMSVSRGCTRFTSTNNPESWLKIMYNLSYPDGPSLLAAPDPSHLEKNGGTLTPEQFKKQRYMFISTSSFLMAPVKELYQRVLYH